ncbi:MAG: hypothetical protein AW07_00334 [Candidatus Accumulibacter sp. SK-11]|nr:MAG: hypothetical protein AW07_00334 [Candidatus Accumulibacter sp. SK-11]
MLPATGKKIFQTSSQHKRKYGYYAAGSSPADFCCNNENQFKLRHR